jgi:hypothetical protein
MSKQRLGLLAVSVLPASLHSAVVIYSPNLTTDSSSFIAFNPSTGDASIGAIPVGDSFGLRYSPKLLNPLIQGENSGATQVAYYVASNGTDSLDAAVNFSTGANLDASSPWLTSGGGGFLNKPGYPTSFPAGTRGYVGLRYGSGTDWNYGWADVSYNADQSLTLHRFANETTLNLGIQAVPESGAGVAGALVAGTLGAWKARERFLRSRRSAPAVEAA